MQAPVVIRRARRRPDRAVCRLHHSQDSRRWLAHRHGPKAAIAIYRHAPILREADPQLAGPGHQQCGWRGTFHRGADRWRDPLERDSVEAKQSVRRSDPQPPIRRLSDPAYACRGAVVDRPTRVLEVCQTEPMILRGRWCAEKPDGHGQQRGADEPPQDRGGRIGSGGRNVHAAPRSPLGNSDTPPDAVPWRATHRVSKLCQRVSKRATRRCATLAKITLSYRALLGASGAP